jgi:hypothetical protein
MCPLKLHTSYDMVMHGVSTATGWKKGIFWPFLQFLGSLQTSTILSMKNIKSVKFNRGIFVAHIVLHPEQSTENKKEHRQQCRSQSKGRFTSKSYF